MTEESAAALEAAPETVVEAPEGEATEGQIEGQAAEGEEPEEAKKSEAAKRREREKAYRARLQSEAAEAKAEAEQAKARRQALLDVAKQSAPPKEADFPDPIEYAVAKGIWGTRQEDREREANGAGEAVTAAEQRAQEIEARERAVIEQSWTAQLAEAKARYADFEAVALSDEVPVTKTMGELIKTSDVGADVAYHLGQNRALAAQIAKMNPLDAARAIGRIEASLQQPKARTETNAPTPISPVRGSASASLNPDKMSMQDYIAARRAGKIR